MQASKVTTITATEMQHHSGQIIRRAHTGKEHFIVERAGYPVVAILPLDHYLTLTAQAAPAPQNLPQEKG